MKQLNSDTFQELHHAPKEYCRESGPLNSKEGSFPALINGLELVAAALAALALLNALLSLSIVSSPLSILSNRAYIEVDVRNWPDEGDLTYILTPADDPERIVTSGEIFSDPQDLELDGLTSDTEYILTFFHKDEVIGNYTFSTDSSSTVPTEPVTEPSTAPTTLPTTEPTTAPTTEPTTVPTTEPTTVPTTPPATRPTDPPEPEPEPDPEPSPIEGEAQVVDVWGFLVDDKLHGYIFSEKHTFTDVPKPLEIEVIQGLGHPIMEYEASYDSDTKTLTISFIGDILNSGERIVSHVSVTFSDGSVGESSLLLCTPKIEYLDLTIVPMSDDFTTLDLHFSGICTLPSVGVISNPRVSIWIDELGEDFIELEVPDSELGEIFQFTIPLLLDIPLPSSPMYVTLTADWIVDGNTIDDVSITIVQEDTPTGTDDDDDAAIKETTSPTEDSSDDGFESHDNSSASGEDYADPSEVVSTENSTEAAAGTVQQMPSEPTVPLT